MLVGRQAFPLKPSLFQGRTIRSLSGGGPVDGRNPAPPVMYETLLKPGYSTHVNW